MRNLKTTLNDRVLCSDGDSIVELPFLYDYILNGNNPSDVYVSKQNFKTEEVQTFNRRFPNNKVTYKTELKENSLEWEIPKKYKKLNVEKYIASKLKQEIANSDLSAKEIKKRVLRVKMELRIWNKRKLDDLLRTLIYIVNTFEENKIVWGTGRGSSCASYVLYLVGIHQVDSVLYDLDIGEFFR